MQLLKDGIKSIYRRALVARVRREAAGWAGPEGSAAKLLGAAVRGALADEATPEEREWIRRIEALRRDVSASRDPIHIQDFGAGTGGETLSEEEMRRGRVRTRTVGDLCKGASKPYHWSLLLFRLIRAFRPQHALELGTCLGISASYQAAALRLNGAGRLATLEGSPPSAALARQHLARLGLDNATVVEGRFEDTLSGVLADFGTVDYAFIDGHHDERATVGYFEQLLPLLSERAVLVFDDIAWSDGMKRAWATVSGHERVAVSADLGPVGICVVERAPTQRQRLRIPFV